MNVENFKDFCVILHKKRRNELENQKYNEYILKKKAFEIRKEAQLEGLLNGTVKELVQLTEEIMEETGTVSSVLLVYLFMLDQEQYRYDAEEAYRAGAAGKKKGFSFEQSLTAYFREQALCEETDAFYSRFCRYHTYLCRCLKEKRWMLEELLTRYRQVYGAVNRSIGQFVQMGYDSERKNHIFLR